jgi:hypothetical protein
MKTPFGRECPHFFGDYFRGRNVEECRLLAASKQEWTRDLCKFCPVPGIAQANACESMKLTAKVTRPLSAAFMKRVQVTAYCEKSKKKVSEPQVGCGDCHALPFKFEVKS